MLGWIVAVIVVVGIIKTICDHKSYTDASEVHALPCIDPASPMCIPSQHGASCSTGEYTPCTDAEVNRMRDDYHKGHIPAYVPASQPQDAPIPVDAPIPAESEGLFAFLRK